MTQGLVRSQAKIQLAGGELIERVGEYFLPKGELSCGNYVEVFG